MKEGREENGKKIKEDRRRYGEDRRNSKKVKLREKRRRGEETIEMKVQRKKKR